MCYFHENKTYWLSLKSKLISSESTLTHFIMTKAMLFTRGSVSSPDRCKYTDSRSVENNVTRVTAWREC